MSSFFLNPWLLAGLAGICLPVIAHLLSRRRFDVVDWGAMQFLNPARRTRRRLKLQELLLLLLRIGLIVVLALAAARPWLPSGLLSGYRSAGSRAVVLVLDGSNSMARSDGLNTLHQLAIRRAQEFLDSLGPGDTVALIDARDQPRTVIESPLQDLRVVREALQSLPAPAGAGNLQAAAERAVEILGRTSSAAREVVLLTDRQRVGWQPDNAAAWDRFEDLLTFPAVRPKVWSLNVASGLAAATRNIAVGRLQLSRDLTVPDFPLRLNARIRSSADQELQVPIRLLLDGQPLAEKQQDVTVPPRGEASVELEVSVRPVGTHILSLEAITTEDPIPADNISHAAVHVTTALPVLLINGQAAVDPAARETFFASIALTSPGHRTPWVQAHVVEAADVQAADIQRAAMVVLADVRTLPAGIPEELSQFARRGNGVLICCGPQTTADSFEQLFVQSGLLEGVRLLRTRQAAPEAADPVRVSQLSLQSGWLDRFRSDPSRSFLKATFQQWWLTQLTDTAVVLAQLTSGDPLLIQSACGEGSVLLMTSSLSRRWNDLPTRADYVPFLHEAVFQAAASRIRRNVDAGTPLIGQLPDAGAPGLPATPPQATQTAAAADSARYRSPAGVLLTPVTSTPATSTSAGPAQAVLTDTGLPGIYDLLAVSGEPGPDAAAAAPAGQPLDRFVVNYDHTEDDLAELTADDRARLIVNDRLRFADSLDDLQRRMFGTESRTELWAGLLFLFLTLLLAEVWLTRRMVLRGHGSHDSDTAGSAAAA